MTMSPDRLDRHGVWLAIAGFLCTRAIILVVALLAPQDRTRPDRTGVVVRCATRTVGRWPLRPDHDGRLSGGDYGYCRVLPRLSALRPAACGALQAGRRAHHRVARRGARLCCAILFLGAAVYGRADGALGDHALELLPAGDVPVGWLRRRRVRDVCGGGALALAAAAILAGRRRERICDGHPPDRSGAGGRGAGFDHR